MSFKNMGAENELLEVGENGQKWPFFGFFSFFRRFWALSKKINMVRLYETLIGCRMGILLQVSLWTFARYVSGLEIQALKGRKNGHFGVTLSG